MGILQISLPGCNYPFSGQFDCPISTCIAAFVQVAPLFFHSNCPSARDRGRWVKNLPNSHEDTVEELRRGASFVPPLPLSVPIVPSHSNRDTNMQTKEVLGFSLALRQVQKVTQSSVWMKADPCTGRVGQKLWGPAIQDGSGTRGPTDQDAEQMDTTFREVLSQMSQANSVRLLPWSLSTSAMSSAGPTHSVIEALTSITTSELEGTTAPVLMSSPAHRVSMLPTVPPALDIPAAGTPVGQLFFTLTLGLKHKEWDCSPGNIPED